MQFLKFVFVCALVLMSGYHLQAQQWLGPNNDFDRLYRTGNVGIGSIASTSIKLAVFGSGQYGVFARVQSNFGSTSALAGLNTSGSGVTRGVQGRSLHNSLGSSYGVSGLAGNAPDNHNYGVMGTVTGSNKGAGIVGYDEVGYPGWNYDTEGSWAGYFRGSVHVSESVQIGKGLTKLVIGNAGGPDLNWGTSYIGYNAARSAGNWLFSNDTANNGGGITYTNVDGKMYFVTVGSTGASNQTLTDQNIYDEIKMAIDKDGKVTIGTHKTPSFINSNSMPISIPTSHFKLFVEGGILTEQLVIETGWADYVFEEDYQLLSLQEVEAHIQEKGHLPNTPSAAEIENNGLNVGAITVNQQEKIEEIFLHLIDMNKKVMELQKENDQLRKDRSIREVK